MGDHWEGRGSKGRVARFPLPSWAPGSLLRSGPDPLPVEAPSSHTDPEGVGGREGGAKVKAGLTGLAPRRGGWGKGGVPTPSGTQLVVQLGQGRPQGGHGRGCGGMEGNLASAFPVHLGTGEPLRLPGLILCPQSLPLASYSPSPAPPPPPGPTSILRDP